MKTAVLSSLAMAWAWGVIAGSVGLNALIKSNQEKTRLRKSVPAPAEVTINTNDVLRTGIVLTVAGAVIAVVCSFFILILFIARRTAVRTFVAQSFILAFCATWLLATLIPFTYYFATRSAKVTASIGGIPLPDSIVKGAEEALGSTSVYRKIPYLRLVAILPWITVFFTILAAAVVFVAADRASGTAHETIVEEKPASATPPTADNAEA